jgi:general stress protein 26
MNNLKKRIASVFTKPSIVSAFATITENGKPWVRYVCAILGNDFKIRFATFANSRKVAEVKKNPNVHLTCGKFDPKIETYLQIEATASITDLQEERKNMWYEDLGAFFIGQNDPNYVVMILDPSRIEVYGPGLEGPEVWRK